MDDLKERDELIKQIRNRCEAYLLLRSLPNALEIDHLMPTLIEDIFEDCQELIDSHCVVKDK